jgi:hypothetical protein
VFFMDNVPVHIVDEATNLMNVELHYFHQIWPQFSSPLMLASFEVWRHCPGNLKSCSYWTTSMIHCMHRTLSEVDCFRCNQIHWQIMVNGESWDNPKVLI